MENNQVLQITPDVHWVGILDYDIVTFDIVMETRYGTTYNSYFINADKKALIETSKEKFHDVYLEKLRRVVDPSEIEFIILDHTEPDHSGNLKHLLGLAPGATVVGSGNAIRYLREMVGKDFRSLQVKDGDTLDLGNKTLRFIGAPNLHWPDSIYTYLPEDKLLFTCDSFGSHYCREEMFDDMVGDFDDAFKYYFDVILKPFSKFMLKAIDKIKPLEIKAICPGHGPILRTNWKKYVDLSEQYSREYLGIRDRERKSVLIAYVSAYGYTGDMAKVISEGIGKSGEIDVELVDIEDISSGSLEEMIVRNDALLVGSPTINQNTLIPVYKLFGLINPLRDRGKLAAAFGSYGWSGEAVKLIEDNLRNLKLTIAQDAVSFKFYPHGEKAEELENFGRQFGEKLLKQETAE
ncbi:MAG: FprA family A-type flavoprotein [Bacteroidales bacterium]|nr:MAG: FprA family A-type flavoprotein [Bacteroidales bacterium]